MDDGWGAFAIAAVIAAVCYWMEWADKRAGRYPRDWRD